MRQRRAVRAETIAPCAYNPSSLLTPGSLTPICSPAGVHCLGIGLVPDAELAARPGEHDVLDEARVLAQRRRHEQAALRVDLAFVRTGQVEVVVVLHRGRREIGALRDTRLELEPLRVGPCLQTANIADAQVGDEEAIVGESLKTSRNLTGTLTRPLSSILVSNVPRNTLWLPQFHPSPPPTPSFSHFAIGWVPEAVNNKLTHWRTFPPRLEPEPLWAALWAAPVRVRARDRVQAPGKGRDNGRRGSISRILCPLSGAAVIPLDRRLPAGSSDIPEVERGPRALVLVLLRVGFAARRRHRRRGSSPIVSPTPRSSRGRLLSVALSPDRSGPPLAATLPCGVRTFLPPRSEASDCLILSGRTGR